MYPQIFVRLNEYLERFEIDTFTIFITIGVVALTMFIIYFLEKKNHYSREQTNRILLFFAIGLVTTYIFAMFFDALFHFFSDGEFEGGITYIAGFLGGVIVFALLIKYFMKTEKKNILKLLNIIIPGVVLAHAIGRIGCFSVGCCYGKPTDSIFGIFFPAGTNPYLDGIREEIHPTQLYESFFLFVLFFGLLYIPKIKEHKFASYLISYGVFRFILEKFFRGDNRGVLMGLPPSQLLSIVMAIAGIVILYFSLSKNKEKKTINGA